MKGLAAVILAAGSGTRMNSPMPKVLHTIFDKPMLLYALDAACGLRPDATVVVVGEKNAEQIKEAVKTRPGVSFALQKEQKGTANALRCAASFLKGFKGTIVVLNGDSPLLRTETLKRFLSLHRKAGNALSAVSFAASDPGSYGRVVRDALGRPLGVVEEKDANADEKKISEVNSGIYAIEPEALPLLDAVKRNRLKGEYYLTDIVGMAVEEGLKTGVYRLGDESEFLGVNTREELCAAHELLRESLTSLWLKKGVNFIDPKSVFIEPSVKIGKETLIYPNVYLHGNTVIGKSCTIYPNVRIVDSIIKDGSQIKDSTLIEGSSVGPRAEIGPFAHIRPGSRIGASKIGNFVEVKKSTVADGTKAMHLSYLGDAMIGKGVNIGAGTITCNYDGKKKHRTVIENDVFIGSDSQLVAPVKLGKASYIGAGSTITKDVPPHALAVSRTAQKIVPNWRKKR